MPEFSDLSNSQLAPASTVITTGASPVNADPNVRYYEIHSGGTGGNEIIDLDKFELDGNGLNMPAIGQTVVFCVTQLTNPSDVPVVITDGGVPFVYGQNFTNSDYRIIASPGVVLDFVGAIAVFRWVGGVFQFDLAAGSSSDDSTYDSTSLVVFKNLVRMTNAIIYMTALPTADPHAAGQLWNSSGTVMVSAG